MTDYGLKVKNAGLGIQIDSVYKNYVFKEGADSISISNGNTYLTYFTVVNFANSTLLIPLVLFRPSTNYFVTVPSYNKSGDNYTGFNAITQAGQTTTIDWKLHLPSSVKSAETYGLRIYNPSSELVFDSGLTWFRIVSIHSIDLANPTTSTFPYEDIVHSSISNPFYILSAPNYWTSIMRGQPGPPPWSYAMMKRVGIKQIDATSVRVGWFSIVSTQVGGYYDYEGGPNQNIKLIVCNVA